MNSNRTSIVSVEEFNKRVSKEYEITDGGNSNMKVVVRVRPENAMEIRSNCETVVKVLDEHVLVFDPKEDNNPAFQQMDGTRKRRALLNRKRRDLRFAFDRVFDENSSQVQVFEHTTKSVIDGLLDGVNCSVFAYGATGAGKTFTMSGTIDDPGVMFLTTMELYKKIDQLKHEKNCQVAVTYLEVYNETIKDLLSPSGVLPMREDSTKGLVVSGLTQHQPSSAKDLLQMLENGNKNRTQHPTDANATSSRSHAVFQVYVNQTPRAAGLSAQVTQGKMSLIDLAGSERGTVTTNKGARLREGANINKSLLALGNCINALASNKGKTAHVPYRNSKLTRLLKDSLGGNCKTVMIANISPSSLTYEDTYNTLKYSDRAKQIKTKLVRNVVNVDYHVTRYRTIVVGLQKEIDELKTQLHISSQPPFNIQEADRLKGVIENVYCERTRLRKNMADLDAAERDTLLRVLRKERELQRVEVLTGDDRKLSKLRGKLDFLCNHLQDIKEKKTIVHLELSKNNESIGRTLSDINTSVTSESDGFSVLRCHVDLVFNVSKLEAENAYQWKQTKHLLKYIKNQEKEISKTEKILTQCLELIGKQYQLLEATNSSTPVVRDMYDNLAKQIEGDKEVGWSDQTTHDDSDFHDFSVSSLAPTHQALIDTIIAHSSPFRKTTNGGNSRYSSPINAASLGLLTVSTNSNTCSITPHLQLSLTPPSPPPKSPSPSITRSSPHPLMNRMVATNDQKNYKESNEATSVMAGKVVVSPPLKSPKLAKGNRLLSPEFKQRQSGSEEQQVIRRSPSNNKRVSPNLHCAIRKEWNESNSPVTSPRLKKKRVMFNSPPPAIQEMDEEETDSNGEPFKVHKQPSKPTAKPMPPSPPPRKEDMHSTKKSLLAFSKMREEQKRQEEAKNKPSSPKRKDKIRSSFTSPKHGSPSSSSKGRINLAELTSISPPNCEPQTQQTVTVVKPHPIPPVNFQTPAVNTFEDNVVSSYPACSKKLHHTPLGKSASIDNPTYSTQMSCLSLTPYRQSPPTHPSLSQPSPFRPVPNQHPAFPPPLPQRVFNSVPLSPISQTTPKKPAFLPVSKTKTFQRMGSYRSPVNIPIQPLPTLPPPPPIPSPSTISKTRTGYSSSDSTTCISSSSQFTDSLTTTQQHQGGFVLHPAIPTPASNTNTATSAVLSSNSKTKPHRYSLTSPTQSRENMLPASSRESKGFNNYDTTDNSDKLNSTFTIAKPSSKETRKYAVLEPMTQRSSHRENKQRPSTNNDHKKSVANHHAATVTKPLAVLQVGLSDHSTDTGSSSSAASGEKKQPNYLALTKSAAFKKVHRAGHHMKNQKENYSVSNGGQLKSQSMKVKNKIIINRSLGNRSHSVSTAS